MIKTWLERMPARLPEDQLNCTLKQVSAMQAEIDELRAALQERDEEIDGWKADQKENLQIQVDQHQVVTAQRKVLEQALNALMKKNGHWGQGHDDLNKATITAIQEQLA